jgi:DNA mismatch repair protein MutS
MFKTYLDAKQRHPNMLLLFRMGDFFELYGDDAETAAAALGLVLTSRTDQETGKQISMAGFPHHVLESYLRELLNAGHRVAVCDQVEEAPAHTAQSMLFDEVEE